MLSFTSAAISSELRAVRASPSAAAAMSSSAASSACSGADPSPPSPLLMAARRMRDTCAVVSLCSTKTRQRESSAALRLKDGPPVTVNGERFLLAQAISNLTQNALDFSAGGGTISIDVSVENGLARVIVDDRGSGVPDYALPRIGERFYSLVRPETGRKSTGLGLSMVIEIARLHGGNFALRNRPKGGARAEFTIRA